MAKASEKTAGMARVMAQLYHVLRAVCDGATCGAASDVRRAVPRAKCWHTTLCCTWQIPRSTYHRTPHRRTIARSTLFHRPIWRRRRSVEIRIEPAHVLVQQLGDPGAVGRGHDQAG